MIRPQENIENKPRVEGFLMQNIPVEIIFVFVASIASGYTADLIGCDMKYVLENNIWIKHLMGLFTLAFFIVLADEKSTESFWITIAQCMVLYLWFMMLIRTPLWITLFVLAILFSVYVLDIKMRREKDNVEKYDKYSIASYSLKWISLGITIIGYGIYFYNKKREFGEDFNIRDFALGRLYCDHDNETQPQKKNNKAYVFR
ncbi:hypothetical protein TetV_468 [Tetraselmis virus 1]|uniref:Uncharacterized protein n=1 Tax=Tetraselmis virus 1 TaxID=2060617 RepID=A0A2P0VNU9_9VIRU|nr:hypothetical protein QJ968_gp586 [Tetraselmis virus 1]AUF82550.1 hypothetical protein TetV_468 [Tetraselmis virus 1]